MMDDMSEIEPSSAGTSDQIQPKVFAVGDLVVVADPDGFVAEVRNKVKNGRVGEVVRVRDDSDCMVSFPKAGNRKQFRHAFRQTWLSPAPPEPAPRKPGM